MERSDQVAKLAGLMLRVQWALAEGADLKTPLHHLAVATERGLNHDPWMRLHCLVQDLKNEIDALDGSSAEKTTAGRSAHEVGCRPGATSLLQGRALEQCPPRSATP